MGDNREHIGDPSMKTETQRVRAVYCPHKAGTIKQVEDGNTVMWIGRRRTDGAVIYNKSRSLVLRFLISK